MARSLARRPSILPLALLAALWAAAPVSGALADSTQTISFTGSYSGFDPCLQGTPDIGAAHSGTTTIAVLRTTDSQSTPIYKSTVSYTGSFTHQGHTYQFQAQGGGQDTVAHADTQHRIDGTITIYFTAGAPGLSFQQVAPERVFLHGTTGVPTGDTYFPTSANATCTDTDPFLPGTGTGTGTGGAATPEAPAGLLFAVGMVPLAGLAAWRRRRRPATDR